MVAALGHLVQRIFHVVAQVIEAELIVRAVGDVGGVSGLALVLGNAVDNHTGRHAEGGIDAAHPFSVAAGKIIIDRDDVDALAFKSVEIGGEGGHQRLALTGAHLGDGAGMQDHAAHQLNVEVAHVVDALCRFTDDREGLFQQAVQGGAVRQAFAELGGLAFQRLIGEGLHDRLECVDPVYPCLKRFEFTVIDRTENLAG